MAATVLNIILSHQPPEEVRWPLRYWKSFSDPDRILLAYGGTARDFARIDHEPKVWIDDPRLRTQDHQREMQSYTSIFKSVAEWMKSKDFQFIHFAEYDHVPLVNDLNRRQIEKLDNEGADVLGFHVLRVDDTGQPHYLYHVGNPRFQSFISDFSVRGDHSTVLSMFVTGSFWSREAFEAIANTKEPFPMYLEIFLPTLVHHLGFRLRDYGEQNKFVSNLGDRGRDIESARDAGAWSLHPVKEIPSAHRTG
jgi:hypothetical protein